MASMGTQMLGSTLCLLGWVGVIFSCLLPMWRVTAFVGSTIVTSQTIWEGIWMTCVVQSTGQIQCKPYESLLALTADLQAARALMVLAIVLGAVGLVLAFIGGKCTRFMDEDEAAKGKVAVAAGAVLIATGLLCLIPTSWAAGAVVRKFYSASIDAQRRELGACLYIGWGASILLMLGGGLFISSTCPLKAHDTDKNQSVRYVAVRSSNRSSQGRSQPSSRPAVRSQPVGALFSRPQTSEGASTKSQLQNRHPWEDRPIESERSWAPSTKSQMQRPESTKSEDSEALSTKSQLQKAEMQESETGDSHDQEDVSSNPARTYL